MRRDVRFCMEIGNDSPQGRRPGQESSPQVVLLKAKSDFLVQALAGSEDSNQSPQSLLEFRMCIEGTALVTSSLFPGKFRDANARSQPGK